MRKKLRRYFLAGIVVTAPIAITLYLTWLAVDSMDDLVRGILPASYNPETYLPFSIPGIGLVIAAIFLTLIGALAANLFGRALIRWGEGAVNRTPLVRAIYSTLKHIAETVLSKDTTSFREVVLVEYPRKGLWAMAFVACPASEEIASKTGDEMVNVFLPTTPNPTSGFLLFVPKKDCIYLDMPVNAAVKYLISAGLVEPGEGVEGPMAGPARLRLGDTIVEVREAEPESAERSETSRDR